MTIDDFMDCLAALPNAKLFHAAQLRDFETYVRHGYVVPRAQLFEEGTQAYTPFASDKDDVERMDCDADCFGNLLDQGNFSNKGNGIPNVYGPITLYFRPAAMTNTGATDVTVRRNAIWSSKSSYADVLGCADIRGLYNAAGYAKSGEFQIHGGALRIDDLAYVVVNPITVNRQTLKERVEKLLANVVNRHGYPIAVYERNMSANGRAIYDELVAWAGDVDKNDGEYTTLPKPVQVSFEHLGDFKAGNLERFAKYLDHGTLSRMRCESGQLPAGVSFEQEYDDREDPDDGAFYVLTSLDEDAIFDRDTMLQQVEVAEFHLIQSRLPHHEDDDEARTNRIDLAWENYRKAVSDLNYWIEQTRNRILGAQDHVHEFNPYGHDTQLSANLGGWADEFEEVEFPDLDPDASENALVDWQKVRNYSESGW
jgi:hypothetical protein